LENYNIWFYFHMSREWIRRKCGF